MPPGYLHQPAEEEFADEAEAGSTATRVFQMARGHVPLSSSQVLAR
jgi:hypothetical protein